MKARTILLPHLYLVIQEKQTVTENRVHISDADREIMNVEKPRIFAGLFLCFHGFSCCIRLMCELM